MADGLRFFRTWLRKPVLTGAVSPSGKALARAMAALVEPDSRWPVLELGPGTGPVTAALIERGVAPERIVAVEFNPDFCALLVERLPRPQRGRGRRLRPRHGAAAGTGGPVRGGHLQPAPAQPAGRGARGADRIGARPGAARRRLVQFSYGFGPPVPAVPGRFTVERIALVLDEHAAGPRLASIATPDAPRDF